MHSLVRHAACFALAMVPVFAATSIQGVRHYSGSSSTTITVELDGPVAHPHRDTAENPPRFWVDLPDTHIRIPGHGTRFYAVSDGLVQQVRIAQYTPKVARIVLDLDYEATVELRMLRKPYRLQIEVRMKKGAKSARELRAPASTETAANKNVEKKAEPAPSDAPKPAPVAETKPAVVQEPVATEPADKAPVAKEPEGEAPKPEPTKSESAKSAPSRETKAPAPAKESSKSAKDAKPTAASAGSRSLTRALGLKIGRVVIDAGHGGHDEGTRGPNGLLEKELTLDIAQRLGALIQQKLGAEIVYTRSTDVYVGLEERTAIANRESADLFLSIHANSSPIKTISGSDAFYLSTKTTKEELELAARENASTDKSVHELQDLLKKIALTDKVTESQFFAARVQRELTATWAKLSGGRLRNRPVKKAPFVVLIGARMPSVLAEIGFISNPRDEALLKKSEQRQRIAEALYRGVNSYVSTLSRAEPARSSR